MTYLILKRAGRRDEEYYDVIADGEVVGRIMLFAATPGGLPWMWSLAYGQLPFTATPRPAKPPWRRSRRAGTERREAGNDSSSPRLFWGICPGWLTSYPGPIDVGGPGHDDTRGLPLRPELSVKIRACAH
jgi:hypothetical protein